VHGMKQIIDEAETLPVEERLIIIDSLLRTLNPPVPAIDSEWTEIAERRLKDLRLGATKNRVAADEVFRRIRERFKE